MNLLFIQVEDLEKQLHLAHSEVAKVQNERDRYNQECGNLNDQIHQLLVQEVIVLKKNPCFLKVSHYCRFSHLHIVCFQSVTAPLYIQLILRIIFYQKFGLTVMTISQRPLTFRIKVNFVTISKCLKVWNLTLRIAVLRNFSPFNTYFVRHAQDFCNSAKCSFLIY